LERQVSTLRRTRLTCLNMALSRQWRRMTVIYAAWASLARQRSLQRKGIIRITSRRFYCIMRLYLGVWWNFGKNSYRSRVLLVFYFPTFCRSSFLCLRCARHCLCLINVLSQAVALAQRCRRTLRNVLKELKRSAFAARAARELYDLDDSASSPVPDVPFRSAPSSTIRSRLVAIPPLPYWKIGRNKNSRR
jgi:hypothetical protein